MLLLCVFVVLEIKKKKKRILFQAYQAINWRLEGKFDTRSIENIASDVKMEDFLDSLRRDTAAKFEVCNDDE